MLLLLLDEAYAGSSPTCPAGSACSASGTVTSTCATGYYSPEGESDCLACPSGYQCPAPAELASLCPYGTYRVASVSSSPPYQPWYCESCPAGSACPTRDAATPCPATAGSASYSLEGEAYCTTCPTGYYCPTAAQEPVACLSGWYSAAAATACTECPRGSFCPSTAITAPLACPEGTYAPLAGMTACENCPVGYICPLVGGVAPATPTLCPSSVISLGNSIACSSEVVGYSTNDRGAEPQICPSGTQRGGSTASPSCLLIAAGHSGAFTADDSGGTACPAGQYRALDGGPAACRACPAGHTCSSTAVLPTPCDYSAPGCSPPAAGQFKSNAFESAISCPSGTFAIGISFDVVADAAFMLANGIGDAGAAKGSCHACPPGYQCPAPTTKPTACSPGHYSLGNSTACAQCSAGSSCPSTTQAPQACSRGAYSAAGATSCTICPAGDACPTPYAVDKVSCSTVAGAGQYSLAGQSFCSPCPISHSCSSPRSVPQRCPAGQTSALGLTTCADAPASEAVWSAVTLTACPTGHYSPAGALSCYACPAGYSCSATAVLSACSAGQFSGRGHMTCHTCPKGFQCPFTGQSVIQQCPPGTYSQGNQAYCIECPANKQCEHRDSIDSLKDGFWSPAGTGVALVCPAGALCKQEGVSEPQLEWCPYGTWSAAGSATCTSSIALTAGLLPDSKGFTCAEGFYSEAGWSHCAPCEEGQYWKVVTQAASSSGGAATATFTCVATDAGDFSLQSYLAPLPCPAGTYASWSGLSTGGGARTTLQCQPCDPGVVCPSRSVTAAGSHVHDDTSSATGTSVEAPHVCPYGFFCNIQDEYPARLSTQPCPVGKYPISTAAPRTTEAAQCTVCPEGYYCRACAVGEDCGSENGEFVHFKKLACPRGYYCPEGVRRSTEFPCPAGTYQPLEGQTSISACTTCAVGSYCLQGSAAQYPCPPGSYCPTTGIRDPQEYLAPAGRRLPATGASTLPSSAVTDANADQLTAATCVAGLCPPGSSRTYPCPAGYYTQDTLAPLFAKYQCTLCEEHRVCPTMADRELAGGKSFTGTDYDCKKGYLCPKQTESWEQKPCPPGSWDASAAGTSLTSPTACTPCAAGFACPEGTGPETSGTSFAAGSVGRKRTYCEPGHYCPSGTLHDRQFKCPGGTYTASTSLASSDQCTACPAGSFCPPGSYRPHICPAGYYCPPQTISYADSPCPSGTYGKTEDNAYALGLSLASQCTACPAGYFCKSWTVTPQRCPVGSYMPDASAQMADRDNAAAMGVSTALACLPCTAGYSCPEQGMTAMTICPIGTYSPAESSQCFDCRAGHYCLTAGLTEAQYAVQVCGVGQYCAGKAASPIACPMAYYCGSASFQRSLTQACPVGTYANALGLSSAAQCLTTGTGYYTDTAASLQRQVAPNECTHGHRCPAGAHSGYQEACEPGYYQDETAQGVCKSSPAGSYCTGTTARPLVCPPGHYCIAQASEPVQCPVGTFGATAGLVELAGCSPCLAGHYCAQAGLEFPDGLCDPGSYCIGGASVSAPRDGVTGSVCPQGGYCEMGSRRPHNCPPGTYNGQTGGRSRYDCAACPPGKYCAGTSNPQPDGSCSPGYYCPARSQTPYQQTTLPGYYSEAGAAAPTPCAAGTYGPFTAQSACMPCPAGFYCPDSGMSDTYYDCPKGSYCPTLAGSATGSASPTACPTGTYGNVFNLAAESDCKPCRPGYYCATTGLTAPSGECQPGFFCSQRAVEGSPPADYIAAATLAAAPSTTTPDAGPCPPGFYCPAATAWPLPCLAGTFSSSSKATSSATCQACTVGSYCAYAEGYALPWPSPRTAAHQAAPTGPCDAGFFCPVGSTQARPAASVCAAGQKCPTGSSAPVPCPAGTYQTQAAQGDCLACPTGYFCLEGATQYLADALSGPCPIGHFCPANTQSPTQHPCAAGYYSPNTGAPACLLCDPGAYCGISGLAAVSGACLEGYYCTEGSTTAEPVISLVGPTGKPMGDRCPAGYSCPTGSVHPVPCPPGKACTVPGLPAPDASCTAGYYCSARASTATPTDDALEAEGGNRCRPGYYCVAGSGWPVACGPGTYNPDYLATSSSACLPCQAGTYCGSAGLAAPTDLCAEGYICAAGSSSPRPPAGLCPAGATCAAGAVTATPCAAGSYQPLRGQTACLACPAGYRCSGAARTGECGTDHYCPLGVDNAILCPDGTYTKKTTASTPYECSQCPAGKYCVPNGFTAPNDAIVITPCVAGTYCAGGASTPAGTGTCGIGVICPAGSATGQACPPGSACEQPGQATATASCDAGWYCVGGATTAQPTDGLTGDACPAGHYCLAAARWPIPCPIGTYREVSGGRTTGDCTACSPGMICNVLGATEQALPCPAGYYCPTASMREPCPVGHQCPGGSAAAVACTTGTFQPNTHQAACLACPEGYFCSDTTPTVGYAVAAICPAGHYCPSGLSAATACPAGTYNPFKGQGKQSECTPCTAGHYCATTGLATASAAQPCAAGRHCPAGTSTAGGVTCPAGSYCLAGTPAPQPCPSGTYTFDTGGAVQLADCRPCPANYYCPLRGGTSAMYGGFTAANAYACGAGYRCLGGVMDLRPVPTTDSAAVPPGARYCSARHYCVQEVLGEQLCPVGYYQPNEGQSACIRCPAGTLCASTGLAAPLVCPAGQYCPTSSVPTAAQSLPCPAGTYSPFTGATSAADCIPCPEGKYCQGTGLTAATGGCAAGYHCPSGATSEAPSRQAEIGDLTAGKCPAGHACAAGIAVPCGPGQYADVAQTTCSTCPPGRYCPRYTVTPAELPLLHCAAGYYCTAGAKTPYPTDGVQGALCPVDRYCPEGVSVPLRCEPGTYEPRQGSSGCQTCPAGFYCANGLRATCSGGYCLAGSAAPTGCPDGYHDNGVSQLASASGCAYCPVGEYCQGGSRRGSCSAGYYCDFGAAVANQGATAVERTVTAAEAVLVVQVLFLIDVGVTSASTTGYLDSLSTLASFRSTLTAAHPKLTFEAAVIGFYDVRMCNSRVENVILDFTTDIVALSAAAATMPTGCVSGDPDIAGDLARALTDGLDTAKLRWRTSADHFVYLLTDAPAHGTQYWSSTALASLSITTEAKDSLPGEAAGTIEDLIGRYCSTLSAQVQLIDLAWQGGSANYTSQMFGLMAAAQSTCLSRSALAQTGSGATTLPALITTTLTSHLDVAAAAAATAQSSIVTYSSTQCPKGHFCVAGAEYPFRCGAGRYTAARGSTRSSQCVDCPAGNYCRARDNAAHPCPKGHWCPAGADEPWSCRIGTYNYHRGQTSGRACHDCPPGAYCSTEGVGDYRDHLCQAGYFCPTNSTSYPRPCPAGTYLNFRGAENSSECLPCPAGYNCPAAGPQPEPCNNGTYCPPSSPAARDCAPGTYCPFLSASPLSSPAAFYQPKVASDSYILCPNGTYCGGGATRPTVCRSGYFGSSVIQSIDFTSGCRPCDPGFYAPSGANTCLPCKPGYVCLGGGAGSNRRQRRLASGSHNGADAGRALVGDGFGYTCPPGYYCPLGAGAEKACPVGTHQPKDAQSSITSCIACPAGSYGHDVGLSECSRCQGSSNSEAGSSSCQCLALNRIFLRDVGKCVCQTGHVAADGSPPDEDSDVDCEKMVYARCSSDELLDSNGVCRAPNQCEDQCDGGYGAVDHGLGVCICDNKVSAKDVCDSSCREALPRIIFTATGDVQVTDLKTEKTLTFQRESLPQLAGMAKCQLTDNTGCRILNLGIDEKTGDFLADFQPPAILGLPRRKLHSQRFMQGEVEDDRGLLHRNLTTSALSIKNPVVCLAAGSAVFFSGLSKLHYPVYQKNSLLNSNQEFDFGAFLKLEAELKNGRSTATSFAFTFVDAGIYVFRDSDNTAKETIIAVMAGGGACPSGLVYEAKSSSTLLRVGASVSEDVALTPDWSLFLASCIGFLVLILMTAVIVSYVYNKNWDQDPSRKAVMYQTKQYRKLKNSDIEDPKALVSVNSEASSFQFRQQGKTDTFMAMQQEGAEAQPPFGKRNKEVQALDLEELENLKEGLDRQVGEIRKLYSEDDHLDLSDDEGHGDLNTQILQLKRLVEQHKATLQGEEVIESDDDALASSSEDEDDMERQRKLQKQKQAEDSAFEQQQEQEAAQQAETTEKHRDDVAGTAIAEVADRVEEFTDKLKRQGSFSEADTQNLLAEVDATCESMEKVLGGDKARQQLLLQRRLEARRRKRAKLQEDLGAVDGKIKEKEQEYDAAREDVVEKHNKEYRQKCGEYDKEYETQTKALEQNLKEQKHDKLAAYEDKLKDANKSAAFSKVLDEYRGAQDKVDRELDKQREKEMTELQRRLRNRRNKAKSEKELATQEDLKALQVNKDEELVDLKAKRSQLVGLLAQEPAKADHKDQEAGKNQPDVLDPELQLEESAAVRAKELTKQINESAAEKAELEKEQKLALSVLSMEAERENTELAHEIEKASAEAAQAAQVLAETVSTDVQKKQELQKKLKEEAAGETEAQAALMAELKQMDDDIAAKLTAESWNQQSNLAAKLAERKRRRGAQARKECELKAEQAAEQAKLQQDVDKKQAELQAQVRDAKFEADLDRMLMEKTANELPAAVLAALDDKHQEELDDLLMRLYEQRAGELKCQVLALLEEKVQGQTVIAKNFKAKGAALAAVAEALAGDDNGSVDEATQRKLQERREALTAEERKELQQLQKDHQLKKSEVERALSEQALAKENEQVQALLEAQLAERQRVTDERLGGALVRHLLDELDDEAAVALDKFKEQQEQQLLAKRAELEKEEQALAKQLEEELKQLEELKHKAEAVENASGQAPSKKQLLRKASSLTAAKLAGVHGLQKNKQAIKALAKEGSAAYDALSQKFLDEKERQLQALEEQIGARAARRREAAEAKQRAAQGQEEQERKRIQALAEAHLAAQEKFAAFRTTMQKRRRVAFKGGFSQTPLEPFNRTQNDRKVQLEELGNDTQKRAQEAVQLQKLTEILTKIDQLDVRIKSDVRTLKRGLGVAEDFSDIQSTRSRVSKMSRAPGGRIRSLNQSTHRAALPRDASAGALQRTETIRTNRGKR